MRRSRGRCQEGLLLLLLASCTPVPSTGTAGPGGAASELPPDEELLVPPGYGSLHQDEISITLREGAVQVKVTPLEEWIIRLTAPDTYRRLGALRQGQGVVTDLSYFLVSFYSEEEGSAFFPEDLRFENLGRRHAPEAIRSMTTGWGIQRLRPREAESAVYAFGGTLRFDADLVAEYRGARVTDWATILQNLLAEQARARARAGVGRQSSVPSSSSNSYLRSFR